jgi:hypothetical protein
MPIIGCLRYLTNALAGGKLRTKFCLIAVLLFPSGYILDSFHLSVSKGVSRGGQMLSLDAAKLARKGLGGQTTITTIPDGRSGRW